MTLGVYIDPTPCLNCAAKPTCCARQTPDTCPAYAPAPTGTIDLLAYTDKENEVPLDWEESDPRYITNAADVKLRAFSTKVSARAHEAGTCGAAAGSKG